MQSSTGLLMEKRLHSRQEGYLLLLWAVLGLSNIGSQPPWENVSPLSKKKRQEWTVHLVT